MRIIVRLFFYITVPLVAGLMIVPSFIHFDQYKERIITTAKTVTGQDLDISGKISGKLFPLPKLILEDIELKNPQTSLISAEKCEVYFSIFPLLRSQFKVSSVQCNESDITLHSDDDEGNNWTFPENKFGQSLAITVFNSTLSIENGSSQLIDTLEGFNATFVIAPKKKFSLNGSIALPHDLVVFSGTSIAGSDDNSNVKLMMHSNDFNATYEGQFGSESTGKMTMKVNNIRQLSSRFLLPISSVFSKLKSTEAIDIKSDLTLSGDELHLSHVDVSSPSIVANGNLKLVFAAQPLIDVEMKVTRLNLDNMMKEVSLSKTDKADEQQHSYHKHTKNAMVSSFLSNKLNMLLYLDIDDITLNENTIHNTLINGELFNGEIELYPSTAVLPGNVPIELSGTVTHNSVRPIFNGTLSAKGEDLKGLLTWLQMDSQVLMGMPINKFTVTTGLSITPKEVRISSFEGHIGHSSLSGIMSIRHGGDVPSLVGSVSVSRLNLDDLNIPSLLNSLVMPYIGGTNDEIDDIQKLRNIGIKLSLETNFQDIILNRHPINKIGGIVNLEAGSLKIEKWTIDSEQASLEGNIVMDLHFLQPVLTINVKGDHFNTDFFTQFSSTSTTPPDKTLANTTTTEPPKPATPSKTTPHWSSDKLHFLRLDKFNGSVSVTLNTLMHRQITAQNASLLLKMDKGVVVIDQCNADIFSGKFTAKGSMGMTVPSLAISFAFNNTNLDTISPLLELPNLNGYMSVSGSMVTQGYTPADWISHLKSSTSMILRQVSIKGLDLQSVIDHSRDTSYQPTLFADYIKNANTQGTTELSTAEGRIDIEDGILTIKNMNFANISSSGTFVLSANLKDWIMNGAARIDFYPRANAQLLSINLGLKGPINDPTRTIDASLVEGYIKANSVRIPPTGNN